MECHVRVLLNLSPGALENFYLVAGMQALAMKPWFLWLHLSNQKKGPLVVLPYLGDLKITQLFGDYVINHHNWATYNDFCRGHLKWW